MTSELAQPRLEITLKPVVLRMPCMDDVTVRADVPYKTAETDASHRMDLYYPPTPKAGPALPAVLFVFGYPDAGTRRKVGCSGKEMASYISWARLVASFGLVAITYTASEPDRDLLDLLEHLRTHAAELGIDARQIGIWSCSGNVPVALSLLAGSLLAERPVACAVLCYGYMPEEAGLPCEMPLLVVRAGRDEMPGLNDSIDAFVPRALRANLPLTVINHPAAPHAFDIQDDSDASRQVIVRILAFLQMHLRPAMMAIGQEKPGLDAR
jgi:dienelactone hydrolase